VRRGAQDANTVKRGIWDGSIAQTVERAEKELLGNMYGEARIMMACALLKAADTVFGGRGLKDRQVQNAQLG